MSVIRLELQTVARGISLQVFKFGWAEVAPISRSIVPPFDDAVLQG